MGLSFKALRHANVERNKEWNTGTAPVSLTFRGCELAGEAGEAANKLKKLERERLGIKGSRTSINDVGLELADTVICADLVAMDLGIDLGDYVQVAFNAKSGEHGFKTLIPEVSDKLNQWIDDEVAAASGKPVQFDIHTRFITIDDAAEIARGAAVHVITDTETLIGNLRGAGYVVIEPDQVSKREDREPIGWFPVMGDRVFWGEFKRNRKYLAEWERDGYTLKPVFE